MVKEVIRPLELILSEERRLVSDWIHSVTMVQWALITAHRVPHGTDISREVRKSSTLDVLHIVFSLGRSVS